MASYLHLDIGSSYILLHACMQAAFVYTVYTVQLVGYSIDILTPGPGVNISMVIGRLHTPFTIFDVSHEHELVSCVYVRFRSCPTIKISLDSR